MGQVFRARDTRLQRDVAIKILHGDTTGDERARRRLMREARVAAALSHPAIVTVYSVEEVANRLFIVMELVDGVTLADRLATGDLNLSEACEIAAQVAEALAAAHAAGIIHRDVTPRNILLTSDGRAKLADFGLSRAVETRHVPLESTRTGLPFAGTAHYMSPEQVRGDACTPRTDLFSLGSVLYHAVTGLRPFEGPNVFAVLDAISRIDPPLPSALKQGLPAALDTLLGRLLAKPAEDRTLDAMQVARALRSVKVSLADGVTAITAGARETARNKAPFVGRAHELGRLTAALSHAVAGDGTTLVITGDAGMGKTALLDTFLRARQTLAANALVCRGQSVEYSGAGEAYLPMIDALAPMVAHSGQGLHEIVRTHAPSWRAQFPAAYPHEEMASTLPTPARLARELGDALCAAAQSRPVVMILEDLHWADPSTVELLRHLAYRASRAALLLIATCRAEESAAPGSPMGQALVELEARSACEQIELGRLDEANIREYLEWRFGLAEDSAPLASLLFRATEGHPLFLVSLVQLFVQRGDLRQVGHDWRLTTPTDQLHLAIPRTVEAVIRRKLSGLEETDRRLLQHASIEGQEFSTAVLSTLVGADTATLEERLDTLSRVSRIVTVIGPERYPDGSWGARYSFAHAVYQNVVYGDLPPSRRADLHRRAAERLAALHAGRTSPIAAQLARHFKEGREGDRAFDYYMQAGDNSTTLSAGLEADGHYGQAIALAGAEGARIEPRQIALAHWKRAITRVTLGKPITALTDFGQALTGASDTRDEDLVFDIRLAMAYAHIFAEQIDDAIQAATEVELLVEPPPAGPKRLRHLILDLQLKMGRGDLSQAGLLGDTAIALARALGDSLRLLNSLSARAQLDYYRADYASALPQLREISASAAVSRRLADPRPLHIRLHGTFFLGLTLGDMGHVSEAIAVLQSGLESARHDGYVFWVPRLLNAIGWLYGEIGALDVALQHDEEAASEAAGQQLTEVRVESRLNLATDCLRLGRLDRAANLLAEADALTRQNVWYVWLSRIHFTSLAAEDALARGAPARAAELAQEGEELARRYGVWKHVILTARVLAQAAAAQRDWPRAQAHLRHAIDVLTAHPVPIIAWRIHATAARIHHNCGRHAEAAIALEQARSDVRQLSDRILDEPLKATFLRSHAIGQVGADLGAREEMR